MFYLETLGDLSKESKTRSSEDEVRILADKFPEQHGEPNVHHLDICLADPQGIPIRLRRRVLTDNGHAVASRGRIGVNLQPSPESEAFLRWRNGNFLSIEREQATRWRSELERLDLQEIARSFSESVTNETCTTLDQARDLAKKLVSEPSDRYSQIERYFEHLGIDREYHGGIVNRLQAFGLPKLSIYAPYATYVLTVEWFFRIALASGLIPKERPSNWVDISYLFYLPFCSLFVSSDKLHRETAPLFLSDKQQFVWGPDFKTGLLEVKKYYEKYSDTIEREGLIKFASNPPKEGDFFVSKLWDRHIPEWRTGFNFEVTDSDEALTAFGSTLRKRFEGKKVDDALLENRQPDFLTVNRRVSEFRGPWRQVPRDIADPNIPETD